MTSMGMKNKNAGPKIEVRQGKKGTSYRAKVRRGGVYVSRTFPTRTEASKWITSTEADIFKGAPVDTSKFRGMSLGAIIADYIESVKISPKKASTLERVSVELGRVPLNAFATKGFERYLKTKLEQPVLTQPNKKTEHPLYSGNKIMVDGKEAPRTYSSSSVRHIYYAIKTALSWHASRNDYTFNAKPFQDNPPPAAWEKPRDRRLEDEELLQLLVACDSMYVNQGNLKDVLQFQIWSCMRIGETLQMKWRDLVVDEQEPHSSYVHVPKENQKGREKKRIVDRDVPMRPELYALVVGRLLPRAGKADERVFPFWPDSAVFGQRFKRVCKNAGIRDFRVHDLRHEGVSDLFENTSLTDVEIAKISGHLEMNTLSRYANLRPQKTGAKLWASLNAPIRIPEVAVAPPL